MSETNHTTNPFIELIDTKSETNGCVDSSKSPNQLPMETNDSEIMDTTSSNDQIELNKTNLMVEDVFYLTLNKNALLEGGNGKQLVYLEELSLSLHPQVYIDLETLEQGLFERLLLQDPHSCILPENSLNINDQVIEKKVFPYLYHADQNLHSYAGSSDVVVQAAVSKMKELIFRNAVTALKQPALFEDQDFVAQLLDILKDVESSKSFFLDIVKGFMEDGDENSLSELKIAMIPLLTAMHTTIVKSNIINLDLYILPVLQLFASNIHLASIILDLCETRGTSGRAYQDTILGSVLALSVLPKSPTMRYEYFDNPTEQASVSMVESSLNNASRHLADNLHKVFLGILRHSGTLRHRLLEWIGKCLAANASRGKLWNTQAGPLSAASAMSCVSDGFMLTLGAVMLRLCQPFCSAPEDPKCLKIDPTYCAVPAEECASRSVHVRGLWEETCILPLREDAEGAVVPRPIATTYNFVTECFFMAHKTIDLGYRVCADRLSRIGQDLGHAQRALADAMASQNQNVYDALRERMQQDMVKYVSLRCALLEPGVVSLLSALNGATSYWMLQLAAGPAPTQTNCLAPLVPVSVQMPIQGPPPDTLRCIPEFLVENVVSFVSLVRRAWAAAAGRSGAGLSDVDATILLPSALSFVLAYMGEQERMKNPHLRARLAECLEAMLPNPPDDPNPASSLGSYFRDQLFKEHPHRLQLVPCLLDVFVGIEMTGQSVQFEQKFNYRRPMYLVMDFLWEIEEHRQCFSRLAREAWSNMEAVHPPIFLRFVNLLMNDAIFLLDEALSNMAQIRTQQAAQDSGAWNSLSPAEREQNIGLLSHVGMLARFDNILGRDTVRTLGRLAVHAPYIFCHPTMVERVASMLNYFLMHLVGPNKKNFKVKDQKEYEFDPASTVLDICRMYVELGTSEEFCTAVSNDGRSYSPQLFQLAEDVLVRIGGGSLIGSLSALATKVAQSCVRRMADEEMLSDAPEDFLDPIMSTLMLDPVLLPSSRTTLDRTTIARHLLSDQSDPFNRSPLTMDQVKPNYELKARIDEWISEKRNAAAAQLQAAKLHSTPDTTRDENMTQDDTKHSQMPTDSKETFPE